VTRIVTSGIPFIPKGYLKLHVDCAETQMCLFRLRVTDLLRLILFDKIKQQQTVFTFADQHNFE